MNRFPWGDGPAPAHYCHHCGRRIGRNSGHFIVTDGNHLLCGSCLLPPNPSQAQALHAEYYPDCLAHCHVSDHCQIASATRAGAWYVLARAATGLTLNGHDRCDP